MRRCIACRQSKPQDELIRFTLSGEGRIVPDQNKTRDGRGFYLCRDSECIETAIKRKAFNRCCKRNVGADEIKKVIDEAFNNN
jgi:predicted RNA-binding protein YlxR (DUF448 family)